MSRKDVLPVSAPAPPITAPDAEEEARAAHFRKRKAPSVIVYVSVGVQLVQFRVPEKVPSM